MMAKFISIERLFKGTIRPIGALSAILKLIQYIEPLVFRQVESSPNKGKKSFLCLSLKRRFALIVCGSGSTKFDECGSWSGSRSIKSPD